MTAPISLMDMILGKFFAASLFIAIMMGITLIYPVILFLVANPDFGALFATYLGSYLMAICYVAIGLFFSAMTENQIIAGALTFSVNLLFWIISWGTTSESGMLKSFCQYLSLTAHFENFALGLIQVSDLAFYASFIGLSLFLTHRVLDSFRWR
jgi:ABC-2 type transport system permease protein